MKIFFSLFFFSTRWVILAKELVLKARGDTSPEYAWKRNSKQLGSYDDITVFVIPLGLYLKEKKDSTKVWTNWCKNENCLVWWMNFFNVAIIIAAIIVCWPTTFNILQVFKFQWYFFFIILHAKYFLSEEANFYGRWKAKQIILFDAN